MHCGCLDYGANERDQRCHGHAQFPAPFVCKDSCKRRGGNGADEDNGDVECCSVGSQVKVLRVRRQYLQPVLKVRVSTRSSSCHVEYVLTIMAESYPIVAELKVAT